MSEGGVVVESKEREERDLREECDLWMSSSSELRIFEGVAERVVVEGVVDERGKGVDKRSVEGKREAS